MPRRKLKDYKQGEKERKFAQGEQSRRTGNINRTKILLLILKNQPLTFTELQKMAKFSTPVLSDHLKKLKEFNSIEKTVENDKVVYKVVSEEKVKTEVKATLFDFIVNILPSGIDKIINEFVEDFSNAILEMGEEKAVEEKIIKPLKKFEEKEHDNEVIPIEVIEIDAKEETDNGGE